MNVTFYNFSKRRNSTKLPTGGTSYTCLLKDDTTTARPRIAIKWDGTSGSPAAYNYCYIPSFGRYYWVDSWEYTDRQWVASCTVDVLATYKTEIGASTKYVLRAASSYSLFVPDTFYTTASKCKTTTASPFSGLNWASDLNGGDIIIGIMGVTNSLYSVGGVSYYAATPANYMQLLKDLYTESLDGVDTETYGSTIGDAIKALSRNLLRSITNPTQYIKSVKWYPVKFTKGTAGTIKLGGIQSSATLYPISDPIKTQSVYCAVSNVPNGGDYWKNIYPYTTYTAYFPPFGTFALDSHKMAGSDGGVQMTLTADCVSGQAHLRLEAVNNSLPSYPVLIDTTGTIGVPMDMAGVNVNTAQSLASGMQAAASAYAGDFTGAAAGLMSAFSAASPEASSHTTGFGGIAGVVADKFIQTCYYEPADQAIDEFGTPVCKPLQLSTLSGYIKCQDGDVACAGTETELAEIERFLTGGFFYE